MKRTSVRVAPRKGPAEPNLGGAVTPDYPPLSTQVISQTESAFGAPLEPLLAGASITFHQWLVLTVTAASGASIDRGQLIARITDARNLTARRSKRRSTS